LLKAFTISDKDKYIKVKELWMRHKRALEAKIIQYNRKYEVTKRLIKPTLRQMRESAEPDYKFKKINLKHIGRDTINLNHA